MKVSYRAALAALIAGMVATAAVPVEAATPRASALAAPTRAVSLAASTLSGLQYGCSTSLGAIEPDGSLNHVVLNPTNPTGPVARDYLSTIPGVTAMSSTAYEMMYSNQTWYFRTFTVRGGVLRLETMYYPNSNPGAVKRVTRTIGSGWGPVAKIVDASDRDLQDTKDGYFYGLFGKTGTLSRYKVTAATFGASTMRFAGSRTGYGNFHSLALAYRYRQGYAGAADVLIGTTSAGALYLITIPVGGTFTPRLTLLRASTWTFDDLVVGRCDPQYSLIAVRNNQARAYVYRLDTIAGTSSVIRSFGAMSAPWTPAHTSGIWNRGAYPWRW